MLYILNDTVDILHFIREELYLIFKLTFPVYLTLSCLQFTFIIPTSFVGQIGDGKTGLAAINLSNAITNMTA